MGGHVTWVGPGICDHDGSADVQGAWLGKKVAQWIDKRYFKPVD